MTTPLSPDLTRRLIAEAREDDAGFAGEFAFEPAHTEDCGIGTVADYVDISDRLIYVPRADADGDEYVTISYTIDRHVAEPIARMLNRHGDLADHLEAALAESERLTRALDEANRYSGALMQAQLDKIKERDAAQSALAASRAECERLRVLIAESAKEDVEPQTWRGYRRLAAQYMDDCDAAIADRDRLAAELQAARADIMRLSREVKP